ncbi:MAG: serine hydrolase domain-containing protein [Planctomycetota bacterium]
MSLTCLLAVILTACGPTRVENRIRAVETGLVEELSSPGWAGKTLAERMAHHRVPGLSLAVIDGFEISWAKGYGHLRAGRDEPVTPQTLFQTGSIGKPVVAVAALALVQAGKLDLDEDVNTRLQTWRIPTNELTVRVPVTLRQLLSHTAGASTHGYPGYQRGAPLPTLPQVLDGRPPANTPPIRVDWLPGEKHRYSSGGFLILQQLLTDVSGQTFAGLIGEIVFTPLGMQDSCYCPLPQNRWNRAAWGHRADGRPLPDGWHVYAESGAGPFWSTPTDMARFGIELMRSHQGRSDRLLSQVTAREMLTPQPGGFGLGVAVHDDGGDRFYALHTGSTEGFRTLMALYPKRGQGVVIMTNGDTGDLLTDELMKSLSREYGWVLGLTMQTWMLFVSGGVVVLLGGLLVFAWRARRRRRHR